MKSLFLIILSITLLFPFQIRQLYYQGTIDNERFINCKVFPDDYGNNNVELLNLLFADILGNYKIIDKNLIIVNKYCETETPICTQHLYKISSKNYYAALLSITLLPMINAKNAVATEEYGVEFIEPFVFQNAEDDIIQKIDNIPYVAKKLAEYLNYLFMDGRSDRNCMNQETGTIDKVKLNENIQIIKKRGFVNTSKYLENKGGRGYFKEITQ